MQLMFEVPQSLSPSRVQGFLSCPMQFRFASIERLPEPPSIHTTRGSLVHRALELLFTAPAPARTPARLAASVEAALDEYRVHADLVDLALDDEQLAAFEQECRDLAMNYLRMEDPSTVHDVGVELRLEATVGSLTLRGIIDRLDLDADGELVVTDYKTGRAPGERQEQQRLAGVAFYSLLCERLFGRRPARVQLLYLADPVAIISVPTDRSTRGVERKLAAIWTAVERACAREDFRPNPSRLCDWCGFKAYCPSFGGDIAQADAFRLDQELRRHAEAEPALA
jgi:putative RecB family exonuclease